MLSEEISRNQRVLRAFVRSVRPGYAKARIAVVITLALVTLIGVMAMGTDFAVLYYNWVQLQTAADAPALAGAGYI